MVRAVISFNAKDPAGLQGALGKAGGMLQGAAGFRGVDVRRGVEQPQRIVLFADWDAVADHKAWMRANETAFLAAVSPFVSGPPEIQHYE